MRDWTEFFKARDFMEVVFDVERAQKVADLANEAINRELALAPELRADAPLAYAWFSLDACGANETGPAYKGRLVSVCELTDAEYDANTEMKKKLGIV
jgi:hypothetical protein